MEHCTEEALPPGNIHSPLSPCGKRISHARRGFAQLAALVSVVMAVVISGAGLYFYQQKTATQALLIPTLDLEGASLPQTDLSARLIGNVGGIDVHFFSASEAAAGFTAPADVHILFHCPSNTTGLSFEVAHGDRGAQRSVRAWGYEYSSNENENEANGRTGRELFDGRFWLSQAELAVTGDRFGHLHTENMQLQADRRYYMMTSADLRVSCVDSDRDGLNDGREDQNGNGAVDPGETDPHDADSDDDGVDDGAEVEGGTDPLDPSSVIECGNGVDDDEDKLIDILDPGCHDEDNDASNTATYNPGDLSETGDRICGNGEVEGSERCDDGRQCVDTSGTLVNCTSDTSVCADRSTCKRRGGDGCSASCQLEGYECDDGRDNDGNLDIDQKDPDCHEDEDIENIPSWKPDRKESNNLCGNREVDAGEECDDGRACANGESCIPGGMGCEDSSVCIQRNNDGCSITCMSESGGGGGGGSVCGNGTVEGSEECDDGNTVNDDGCSSTCMSESGGGGGSSVCGNGMVEGTEQCDDGPTCENGESCIPGGMACEDGSSCMQRNGDGCSAICEVEDGWTCSGSPRSACESILPTRPTQCSDEIDNDGDGQVDLADSDCGGLSDNSEGPAPACSDGVDNDGDTFADRTDPGCFTSGNTAIGDYDQDDPDESHEAKCANGAFEPDGAIASSTADDEQCDDGNTDTGDGCTGNCQLEYACNDGIDNDGDERFDSRDPGCHSDGNASHAATYVSADDDESHTAGCGNGAVEGTEPCDDGNTAEEDGCLVTCEVEVGWTCDRSMGTCRVAIPELPGG